MGANLVMTFGPDDPRVQQLACADERLGELMSRVKEFSLRLHADVFTGLARPIVGQQLSAGAARSIWGRLEELLGAITASNVSAAGEGVLQQAGLSRNKAAYLAELALTVREGAVNLDELKQLDDGEIVARLMGLHGVGRWTAEMFLIFCLGRTDVFAEHDGGLQRAAAAICSCSVRRLPPDRLGVMAERWRPYRTIAALYLWRGLDLGILG